MGRESVCFNLAALGQQPPSPPPPPDEIHSHFLINEFGMCFDEVTASSLVKLTIDGNPAVGEHAKPVFKPGFVSLSLRVGTEGTAHRIRSIHSAALSTYACTRLTPTGHPLGSTRCTPRL